MSVSEARVGRTKKTDEVKKDVEQKEDIKKARPEQPRILKPSLFQQSEFARGQFDATIPYEWDFEDALKPGFWTNIIGQLMKNVATSSPDRTGSFIDLTTEDHAFHAKLYVRAVLPRGLIVQCIGPQIHPETKRSWAVDIETGKAWMGRKPNVVGPYEYKWNKIETGFDIYHKESQQIVAGAKSIKTREQAVEWIRKLVTIG